MTCSSAWGYQRSEVTGTVCPARAVTHVLLFSSLSIRSHVWQIKAISVALAFEQRDSNDVSQCGHAASVSPLRCVQNARLPITKLISAFGLLLFEAAQRVEPEVDFIWFCRSLVIQIITFSPDLVHLEGTSAGLKSFGWKQRHAIVTFLNLLIRIMCSNPVCSLGTLSDSRARQTLTSAI